MINSDRFNQETKSRQPSSLKAAAKYLSKPGLISLGGGLPSSEYFPFEELSIKVPTLGHFSEADTRTSGVTLTAGKNDLVEGTSIFDVATAFNYGQGAGAAQILRWVTEHTEIVHNPPYRDWACTMTIGSTSGFDMILRMFYQPNMTLLTEEYTFSSAAEAARAMGWRIGGVGVDDEGLKATSLDEILSNWDPAEHGGSPKPFLIYTVPSGENPTGATQSLERRKAIYAIAQKHDLLLLEDEPYYFLQMQPYTGQNAPDVPPPSTHAEFLQSLVPSLLSLDIDGRVIRIDSFSKVICPGSRLGWLTAPQQIVERYYRHADVSTQGPCGFSQLALFKLLDEHWGHAGYLDWLIHIRVSYTKRRDALLGACENHLPTSVTRWKPPMAGMFHWLEIDWKQHPLAEKMSFLELEERIWMKGIALGTLLIKGSLFAAERQAKDGNRMFFRMTYAAAPADKMGEALRRFGQALREEFELETQNGQSADGNGHAADEASRGA